MISKFRLILQSYNLINLLSSVCKGNVSLLTFFNININKIKKIVLKFVKTKSSEFLNF